MTCHLPVPLSEIHLTSLCSLFEKCPKALPMFGYDIESEINEELMSDPKFVAHSIQLIGMFDQALGMLGPNGTLLTEEITALGEKHSKYGVRAEMFPIMGKAMIAMLENILGDTFNDEVKAAWQVVFGAISQDLMKTVLRASRNGDAESANQVTSAAVTA